VVWEVEGGVKGAAGLMCEDGWDFFVCASFYTHDIFYFIYLGIRDTFGWDMGSFYYEEI